jgi:hypothetical protein
MLIYSTQELAEFTRDYRKRKHLSQKRVIAWDLGKRLYLSLRASQRVQK